MNKYYTETIRKVFVDADWWFVLKTDISDGNKNVILSIVSDSDESSTAVTTEITTFTDPEQMRCLAKALIFAADEMEKLKW